MSICDGRAHASDLEDFVRTWSTDALMTWCIQGPQLADRLLTPCAGQQDEETSKVLKILMCKDLPWDIV